MLGKIYPGLSFSGFGLSIAKLGNKSTWNAVF